MTKKRWPIETVAIACDSESFYNSSRTVSLLYLLLNRVFLWLFPDSVLATTDFTVYLLQLFLWCILVFLLKLFVNSILATTVRGQCPCCNCSWTVSLLQLFVDSVLATTVRGQCPCCNCSWTVPLLQLFVDSVLAATVRGQCPCCNCSWTVSLLQLGFLSI